MGIHTKSWQLTARESNPDHKLKLANGTAYMKFYIFLLKQNVKVLHWGKIGMSPIPQK